MPTVEEVLTASELALAGERPSTNPTERADDRDAITTGTERHLRGVRESDTDSTVLRLRRGYQPWPSATAGGSPART
ncbi:hypothetical protein BRC90_11040 [Halobacteriales archaeon QS_4_69_34]|nr:MAG: hypothetical protein BRC90_11040 [Halobacteriales archaeon QS_4_69_34]